MEVLGMLVGLLILLTLAVLVAVAVVFGVVVAVGTLLTAARDRFMRGAGVRPERETPPKVMPGEGSPW